MNNPAFIVELNADANPKAAKTEKAYCFEEAVAFAGTGKYQYFLLLVCGCCFMTVMVETMGVSVIMPFLKCDIPSSVDEQGFLASAGFLGVVLSSYLMGFLADTWGRVRTLRTALMCSCLSTVISAFSVNMWMLIVFRFLNGFFVSGCQACIFSYMGEFHKKSTRSRYVTLLAMFLPMAMIYLPGLARLILPMNLDVAIGRDFRFTPWRMLLLLNAGLNLIALCGLFIFPESPRFILIQGRHDEALGTLKRMFARNTGRPESEYPINRIDIDICGANLRGIHGVKDALKTVWSQTTPLFCKERALYTLILCFLMFFIFVIGQGMLMWFPTLLYQLVGTKHQGYLFCESMYMMNNSTNATITSDTCNGPVDFNMFYVLIFIGVAFTVLGLVFATVIDLVGKKRLLKKSKASNEAEKAYSFEEAVALIETGKFHYFLLVVCGLCFTAMAVESFQMGIILPFLQCDLESKLSERGFLTSAGFLGIVFGSHTMGFLADTWGRVKTLRVTLVCSFISTLISACSINIWMLIVLRFVNGFFISGCQGCVFSLVGEFHGQKTRAKHVTLLSAFASCGTLYLPFMGLAILPIQMDITILGIRVMPWRVLIVTNSLISLLAIFGLVFCPESVKFHLIQGRNDEALKTFQKLFHWNTGRPKSEYPVKKLFIEISGANIGAVSGVKAVLELVWKQTISVFYKDRAWHTINICGIMFVINGIGSGIYMWFPTMLNQLAATSEQGYTICETIMMDAGAANSTTNMDNCGGPVNADMFKILIIAGVIFFTMRLIYPFIINTIGQSNILIVTLSLASMVCLGVQWANSFVLSAILLASIMCIGTCGGIVGTITVEYFPTNINAMAVCLVMMVGRLGSVAGSNIMGVLLFNNCNLLFYVNMSILIVAAICSYFLPVRKVAKVVKVVFDPIN